MYNMNKLYNWVFHFNNFEGLWSAIPRELYNQYWDNQEFEGIIKSKDINTLVEIITKNIKV